MQSYRRSFRKEPILDIEVNIFVYIILIIVFALLIAYIKSYFPGNDNDDNDSMDYDEFH